MINKNFKDDWKRTTNGEVDVIDAKHFGLAIDKDIFGFALDISFSFRMVYIRIFNIAIRFYC